MSFQYYPSPFKYHDTVDSVGDSLKKRKRGASEEDTGGDDASSKSEHDSSIEDDFVSLPPNKAQQFRTAGYRSSKDPPGGAFPHQAKGRRAGDHLTPARLARELAKLKPPFVEKRPLLEDNQQSQQNVLAFPGLKQAHVANLHTLMHRCLLEGDYIRAGRAFAMLLRTESDSKQLDIRSHSLWGIGAEILLRCKGQSLGNPEALSEQEDLSNPAFSSYQVTEEAFALAKNYYERLVLEFRYQHWNADPLSAHQLYPIMFCQWIAFIADQSGLATAHLDQYKGTYRSLNEDSDPASDDSMSDDIEHESIRRKTFEMAKEVAKTMSDKMQGFPYSDDVTMWQLRGNLHLWLADLSVTLSRERHDTYSDSEDAVSPRHSYPSKEESAQLLESQDQIKQANFAFEKAKECEKTNSVSLAETQNAENPSRPGSSPTT